MKKIDIWNAIDANDNCLHAPRPGTGYDSDDVRILDDERYSDRRAQNAYRRHTVAALGHAELH